MRTLALWRLAAILLLAAIPPASPALAPTTIADNGNGNNGNQGQDDGNRGHGNDPDGHDKDNPGNSSGPGSGRNDDEDADNGEDRRNLETPVATVPAGYAVEVACGPAEDGATTCVFTTSAPEGGKKVGFLQVPAGNLCAGVIANDAKYDDPQPHTSVVGYTSTGGDKETVTIELDGEVTTGGTATYWIKAASTVTPVIGPGLECDLAATTDTEATVEFDATPTASTTPSTGTVTIAVLTCTSVPADSSAFDWFGECPPGTEPPRDFSLAPSDDSAATTTAMTDAAGEVTFAELAPGDYRLDGSWCHAVSDRVTVDSEVVVEAGVTSTVWIFTCDGQAGV